MMIKSSISFVNVSNMHVYANTFLKLVIIASYILVIKYYRLQILAWRIRKLIFIGGKREKNI